MSKCSLKVTLQNDQSSAYIKLEMIVGKNEQLGESR